MKDSSASVMKAAFALAVSMTLFLNAALASSAVTLESSNPQPSGGFGLSVAISGTTAVVGAPSETGGGHPDAGHAYIIDATANALPITLTSPNAASSGAFGYSVAISGTTVVVGARGRAAGPPVEGHAYVFDAATGDLINTLTSPNQQLNPKGFFGQSVAISGTTVVVGAPSETVDEMVDAGHAYVFDAATGDLINTLTSPTVQLDGFFGQSVAISCSTVVVGAPGEPANMKEGAGRAYTFDATSGSPVWTLVSSNPQLGGEFGSSVAISGTTVVVGAPSESAKAGNAYTFDAASGSPVWTLVSPNALADGLFGYSVAVSGTTVVVGAPDEIVSLQARAGHAHTFDATTGTVIATLTSPYALLNGELGLSVAISECDPTVVAGAPGETASGQANAGHAYLF